MSDKTPRLDTLSKDERHNSLAETAYWCNQYKQFARTLETELTSAKADLDAAMGILEKVCDRFERRGLGTYDINDAKALLEKDGRA